MSRLNWSVPGNPRQYTAILLLAVLVLSAGCLGLGDSGGEDPEMNDTQTPDDPADDDSDDSDDDGDDSDDSDDSDNGTDGSDNSLPANTEEWLSQYEYGQPADDVALDALLNDTVASIETVEGYEYNRTRTISESTSSQEILTETTQETAVDAAGQEASFSRTITSAGQTRESQVYVLNGTLYQQSPQFTEQYGSEWVQQNISAEYGSFYRQLEVLGGVADAIENSSASLVGTTELDGQTAHVVQLDLTTSFAQDSSNSQTNISVSDSQLLVWIDDDSNRVLQTAGYSNFTQTASGREIQSTIENRDTFEYGPVEITLPEAAGTAVEIGN